MTSFVCGVRPGPDTKLPGYFDAVADEVGETSSQEDRNATEDHLISSIGNAKVVSAVLAAITASLSGPRSWVPCQTLRWVPKTKRLHFSHEHDYVICTHYHEISQVNTSVVGGKTLEEARDPRTFLA